MRQSDQEYYRERACQERLVADKAADDYARGIHLQLAALYDERALADPATGTGDAPGISDPVLVQ